MFNAPGRRGAGAGARPGHGPLAWVLCALVGCHTRLRGTFTKAMTRSTSLRSLHRVRLHAIDGIICTADSRPEVPVRFRSVSGPVPVPAPSLALSKPSVSAETACPSNNDACKWPSSAELWRPAAPTACTASSRWSSAAEGAGGGRGALSPCLRVLAWPPLLLRSTVHVCKTQASHPVHWLLG